MKKIGLILAILANLAVALGLRLYRFTPPPALNDYTANPVSQLPPGLHSDEAFNDLAALRLLRSGEWTPYSSIDQGRSVAHLTVTAAVIAVAGPIAEASRITSLIAGMISIAGMLWLVRVLFRSIYSDSDRLVLQLIAAVQVAGTYWFVNFSRAGFELITLPALLLPAFALLGHWLHRPSLRVSLLGGGLLGLTLYTYYAAYALPAIVAVIFATCLLIGHQRRPLFRQMIVYGVACGMVALPLGLYALNSPNQFIQRLKDTTASSETNLGENVVRTVGGLFFTGDTTTAYNLPGRPLLDPIQSVLFVIGLCVCLRRGRRLEFFFVMVWLIVMLLPAMLSNGAPAFNRMAGALPAILLLVALGGLQLYRWLSQLRWKWIGPIALVVLSTFTVILTAHDYFDVWPNSNGLLYTFSMPERLQAEAIASLPRTTDVYLSPSDSQRPMFAYLWQDQARAKSFNGRRCTVAPARIDRSTVWLVNTREDKRSADRLSMLYPSIQTDVLWLQNGTPVVSQFSISGSSRAQLPDQSIGSVGDLFKLYNVNLIGPPQRGKRLTIRLGWQSIAPTTDNWTEAVYFIDTNNQIRVQDDRWPCDNSYPTSIWQPGELMIEDRLIDLPADLPAGHYTLAIVFYRLSDNTRLPVYSPHGEPAGDILKAEQIAIP